jgi:benzylsuccinate CoA-transferase BbsF subunit
VAGFRRVDGFDGCVRVGPAQTQSHEAALAAALYHRRQTGLGQQIDLAQVEAAAHFVEPLLLDYEVNGRVATAPGHDSDRTCPHGVYPAAGEERYVAIAVETTEQWHALRAVAPLDAFAAPGLDALKARMACRAAIDRALTDWTRDQEPSRWPVARRRRACRRASSSALRPLHRRPARPPRLLRAAGHSVMGLTPYDGPVTRFADAGLPRRAAPSLGEHTEDVLLRDLLGLSPEEIAEYAAAGALVGCGATRDSLCSTRPTDNPPAGG